MTAVVIGEFIFFLKEDYIILTKINFITAGIYHKMFAWSWTPQEGINGTQLLISDTGFYIKHPEAGWDAVPYLKIFSTDKIAKLVDKVYDEI